MARFTLVPHTVVFQAVAHSTHPLRSPLPFLSPWEGSKLQASVGFATKVESLTIQTGLEASLAGHGGDHWGGVVSQPPSPFPFTLSSPISLSIRSKPTLQEVDTGGRRGDWKHNGDHWGGAVSVKPSAHRDLSGFFKPRSLRRSFQPAEICARGEILSELSLSLRTCWSFILTSCDKLWPNSRIFSSENAFLFSSPEFKTGTYSALPPITMYVNSENESLSRSPEFKTGTFTVAPLHTTARLRCWHSSVI